MIWDRPSQLRAGTAAPLHFRVVERDGSPAVLEPYMGMAAHAIVLRTDASVFAHLHPSGSVAMPALELAERSIRGKDRPPTDTDGMVMDHMGMTMAMPMPKVTSELAFPFGFPKPGDYRVFVQIKRAGVVETGAFDVHVD